MTAEHVFRMTWLWETKQSAVTWKKAFPQLGGAVCVF